MAGHSKWANIRFRKAAQDKKRGKIFTKLIRKITTAAQQAGPEIASNSTLRTAVDEALSNNMTRDTIDRAIKRGAGGVDASTMVEVRYEGYGCAGVAIMVDGLTDNRNRTVAEVRHAFTKMGGNLGTDGSVAYLFTKQGQLSFAPGSNEDRILEVALEAGASDVVTHEDGSIDVITTADHFLGVKEALQAAALVPEHAEVTMVASTEVSLNKEEAEKIIRLQDMLEDLDDVQAVYTNAQIAPEIYEQLCG
jgi:YebC/PmpR family DNA-binding regulatory protein